MCPRCELTTPWPASPSGRAWSPHNKPNLSVPSPIPSPNKFMTAGSVVESGTESAPCQLWVERRVMLGSSAAGLPGEQLTHVSSGCHAAQCRVSSHLSDRHSVWRTMRTSTAEVCASSAPVNSRLVRRLRVDSRVSRASSSVECRKSSRRRRSRVSRAIAPAASHPSSLAL